MSPEIKRLLDTPEPPELGPGARKQVLTEEALGEELQAIDASELLRAAVLVWHDHLDSAHKIVQNIETADGSYIHAIIHRREPDYWNSKYWFRRVGNHPCFDELSRRLKEPEFVKGWDPLLFVDLCERHDGRREQGLREIQALELELLVEHLAKP